MSGREVRYVFDVGRKFSRLTVIVDKLNGFVRCRCECGVEKDVRKIELRRGLRKSCGCGKFTNSKTHGMEGTPVYNTWAQMLSRCRNPKNIGFHHYGGRGIKVCARWRKFENFYADMGAKPEGLLLERIDNDGDYKPSNCRWATITEQMRNRRVTLRTMYGGKMTAVSEIAEIHGIRTKLIAARLKRGLSVESAVRKGKFNRWDKK